MRFGYMRPLSFAVAVLLLLWAITASAQTTGATSRGAAELQIYAIDVEGGQATLIVAPSGQSLLVDTGWDGFENRDADRITSAAKLAGIKQIDYLLITHYHRDHVGGVTQLADRMKIGTFIDHGPNQEDTEVTRSNYAAYEQLLAKLKPKHIVAKPGDRIPIKGLDLTMLAAAGEHVSNPMPGAGEPNPTCDSEPASPDDTSENARSLGFVLKYGEFRFLDLGDLPKKKEMDLVCPKNLIGKVDLFLMTHHGLDESNSKALANAIGARVAIMNNGPHKGGSPNAWQAVEDSGVEDLWQLHYAMDSNAGHNSPSKLIANINESDGNYIKVTVRPDGSFAVLNSRNQFEKKYPPARKQSSARRDFARATMAGAR
jgi:beta-lactamase superfamily II metal-dependent hydrolase